MAENKKVETELTEDVKFEEMEKAEEFGNVQDFLTGVGIGVGIAVSIITIT